MELHVPRIDVPRIDWQCCCNAAEAVTVLCRCFRTTSTSQNFRSVSFGPGRNIAQLTFGGFLPNDNMALCLESIQFWQLQTPKFCLILLMLSTISVAVFLNSILRLPGSVPC